MEALIDVINELQVVFNVSELGLPQIAVVGTQGSGKRSVLEHLVGRSFLPRTVTRCPLVLQLVNSLGNANTQDYAIFQHNKSKVFTDYGLITKEIEEQAEKLAGGDTRICSTPITIKMYSKTFTNLTLVDLPAIPKVPVSNQHDVIEKNIKEFIYCYIRNPKCIILVVTPSHLDMGTCESIKIAREVDPEGARTLAVVTKLDLIDQEIDLRGILSGFAIQAKLGIIGVVNRSQEGILENKLIVQSIKEEEAFFSKNYSDLEKFHGTPYLRQTLHTLLISHIKQMLPDLRRNIRKKLEKQKIKLENLGYTKSKSRKLLIDLIFKFSKTICASINGNTSDIDTKELKGGARIRRAFKSVHTILETVNPLTGLSVVEVITALINSLGMSNGIKHTFFIRNPFEFLVRQKIKQLMSPCLEIVHSVYKELIKVIHSCVEDPELQLRMYPKLQTEMSTLALDLLESCLQITNIMVHDIININLAHINYSYRGFVPGCSADASPENTIVIGRDHYLVTVIITINYFVIVRRTIEDMLPKLIMCFMVNNFMEHLHSELVLRLDISEAADLFQESLEILDDKNEIGESISALEKAFTTLTALQFEHKSSTINTSASIYEIIQNYIPLKHYHAYIIFYCSLFPFLWFFLLNGFC